MTAILILGFYLLLGIFLFNRRENGGLRLAFLEATIGISGFIFVVTEFLSIFHALVWQALVPVWLSGNLLLFFLIYRNGFDFEKLRARFKQKTDWTAVLYLVASSFIGGTIFLLALYSPPNTYDSMSYHLARVANWIQFASVEFYPTAILRQLYQMPLAEYAILHLHLLHGDDAFANLPQWFALLASGAVISLIVKEFGGILTTQIFTFLLCLTIPMAIVQGSSTQNDLFVGVFICAFFYYWLRAVKSNAWKDFALVGVALGLALISKGTAYIFCFPIGAIFVLMHFFRLQTKSARLNFVKQTAAVLLIGLAFNFIHLARNFALFGSPISTGEEKMSNQNLNLTMALSGLARNYAIHLGTTSNDVNKQLEAKLERIFGAELNNRDSTWMEERFFIAYSKFEDSAGNFTHILLITLALIAVFFYKGEQKKYLLICAFSVLAGFALYAILLKWQPWASRLQLPIFMLGCALTAIVAEKFLPPARIFLAIICFWWALPFLFYSNPRGFWTNEGAYIFNESRQTKYFKNFPYLEARYAEAVNFLKAQEIGDEIGLHIGFNDWEYPFWFLLKENFRDAPKICHVGITNVSAKLPRRCEMPAFVLSTRTENFIEGVEYKEVFVRLPVRVLQKK